MRLVRTTVGLSARDWGQLLQAQWALLVAYGIVMSRPLGALVSPESQREAEAGSHHPRLPEAQRLADAVVRAARYGVFRPRCLVRSVALSRLLTAHGIGGAVVRVGVRRDAGVFIAHAWVELGSQTLGDTDEHVGAFAPLTSVNAGGRS